MAKPFDQFLPGQVGRRRYRWFFFGDWPWLVVICRACKEIIGHEYPDGTGFLVASKVAARAIRSMHGTERERMP